MSECNYNISSYSKVNKILLKFKREVKKVLKKQLFGIYIHGSLATGDFNLNSSDIDFLVVTEELLNKEKIDILKKLHTEIFRIELGEKLEGSYISKDLLNQTTPPNTPRPYVHKGQLNLLQYGYEWVLEKYVLREHGIVLEGPDLKLLIDKIESKDLKRATLKLFYDWWAPMLNKKERLYDREYQAYAVLTMCRVLYTLNHGVVVSKPVAARWVIDQIDEKWGFLINLSLGLDKNSNFSYLEETINFIKFTFNYCQRCREFLD